MPLSQSRLKELFSYDPETGIFTRRVPRGCAGIDQPAGSITRKGYVRFRVDGRNYLAHRLAWLYVYGKWPETQIDHKDENKQNNAIENLRDVVQRVNQYNRTIPRKDNKSGQQGVGVAGNSFRARITVGGKVEYLGVFKTPEEAHQVYLNAKLNVQTS